jgi:hypothetical protein
VIEAEFEALFADSARKLSLWFDSAIGRFSLAVVEAGMGGARKRILDVVETRCAERGVSLAILDLTQSDAAGNLMTLLNVKGSGAVAVHGVDAQLVETRAVTGTADLWNRQRERIGERLSSPTLLVLGTRAWQRLSMDAPDFADWRALHVRIPQSMPVTFSLPRWILGLWFTETYTRSAHLLASTYTPDDWFKLRLIVGGLVHRGELQEALNWAQRDSRVLADGLALLHWMLNEREEAERFGELSGDSVVMAIVEGNPQRVSDYRQSLEEPHSDLAKYWFVEAWLWARRSEFQRSVAAYRSGFDLLREDAELGRLFLRWHGAELLTELDTCSEAGCVPVPETWRWKLEDSLAEAGSEAFTRP